ncbi:hypothetical protein MASR2M12_03400 [Bacteroidales bacterium]
MANVCLECGEPLMGRADKKFCNDQCRSAHYQKSQADSAPLMRSINNQLRKNRMILAKLNPDGKTRIKKSILEKEGFQFKYFTSTYTTRDNRTYFFVYDQGYLPLENDFYALVRNMAP